LVRKEAIDILDSSMQEVVKQLKILEDLKILTRNRVTMRFIQDELPPLPNKSLSEAGSLVTTNQDAWLCILHVKAFLFISSVRYWLSAQPVDATLHLFV